MSLNLEPSQLDKETTVGNEHTNVRKVDFAALANSSERYSQVLLDHTSGGRTCMVQYIRTPAGGGSPAGMHVHDVDQHFFLISGVMNVDIKGELLSVEPGTLIVFPAGTPHRNWNAGSEPTVHLAFNTPMLDPDASFSKPAPGLAGHLWQLKK